MIFPDLVFKDSYKEDRRVREANEFSLAQRANIISGYLFEGKSHRALETEKLGITERGFYAMNILHYYGITAHHKGIYKDTSFKVGISELRMFEGKEYSTIADLLEREKSFIE
jgi:hypothetical protein